MKIPSLSKVADQLQELSPRRRRLLMLIGYPTFGVTVFLVALYASIPRDRIRERLERELSQDPPPASRAGTGMDVTIGDLGLSLLPPGLRLSDVALKQRNPPPGEGGKERRPQTYFIESLELRTSLLDLLIGARSGRLSLSAFGGTLDAAVRLSGVDVAISARGEELALARVPGLSMAVPLPLGGRASLNIDIKGAIEPRSQRFITTSAAGLVELTVEDGVIGDGKSKLVVPGDPFLAAGLTFPRVRLGRVQGRVVIAKSRATLDQVRVKSPDAEAALEGYVELRDPLPASELHLYLRFKPSPELSKKEPTFELLVNGMTAARRADGFLGFSIVGTVGTPLARPSRDVPAGVTVRSGPLGMAQGSAPTAGRLPRLPTAFQPSPSAPAAPASAPPIPEPPPPPPAYSGGSAAPSPPGGIEPPPPSPLPGLRAGSMPSSAQEVQAPPPPAPEQPEGQPVPPPNYPSNQRGE